MKYQKLVLQKDIFSEDETQDTEAIIRKYFPEVAIVSDEEIALSSSHYTAPGFRGPFRGSLALATRLRRRFPYADALNWAPAFRNHIVSSNFIFLDATSLKERGYLKVPLFVRPAAGTKAFSGNVYTQESFDKEFQFMTANKNIDPYTICLFADPVPLLKEWRLIFVNNTLSSGSQYMVGSQLELKAELPQEVAQFGKQLAVAGDFFQNIFDFVIDIAETPKGLRMVEINAFETASFYAADLDKVYSDWSRSLAEE